MGDYFIYYIQMRKPIIGITLDAEDPGKYSKFPWYAIRKNYIDSVEQYNGIALPLAHNLKVVVTQVDKIFHLQYNVWFINNLSLLSSKCMLIGLLLI